jgi:hypothetical protein
MTNIVRILQMIKFMLITLVFVGVLVACNSETTDKSGKRDSIAVAEKERVKLQLEEQEKHLEKIILQNKEKLKEYEMKIATGDTADIHGLPQFVEDMKQSIAKKEERLRKLKN